MNTQAQVFNVPFVTGLSCPGENKLVSIERRDLNANGASITARFSGLEEEFKFHKNRVQQKSGYSALQMAKAFEDWQDSFNIKSGIHFDPVNLGLPAKDQGCLVVPIVIKTQTPISYQTTYIVSENDWNELSAVDQLIVILAVRMKQSTSLTKEDLLKPLAFLLSDQSFNLALRDYFAQSKAFELPGVSFEGSDFDTCNFFNAEVPSECYPSFYSTSMSLPLRNRLYGKGKVIFGPTGKIVSAWLYYAERVLKNLRDSKNLIACNFEHAADTLVMYQASGELRYCANTFNEPAQDILVENGRGYSASSGKTLFITYSLFFPEIPEGESKKEFPNLTGFVPSAGIYCKNKDGGKLVELYPNGNLKSGLMRSTTNWEEFYFEFDVKGKVLKKVPRDCDRPSAWQTPVGMDLVNLDSNAQSFKVENTTDSYFVSEVRPLYQSRPNCLSVQKDNKGRVLEVVLQPNCLTYIRVLQNGGNE